MAKKPDKKTKAKLKKMSSKDQFEQFKKTAQEVGVDESGKIFEKVFEKIVPPRKIAT